MAKFPDRRKSARGKCCTLRLPGCTNQTDTVILAHMPGWMNKQIGHGVIGLALKSDDNSGVFACSHCHDLLDDRQRSVNKEAVIKAYLRAVKLTNEMLLSEQKPSSPADKRPPF